MFYKITKKINEILNWIYSKDGYYALKSGLYFDHFFKKVSSKIIKDISFFFGLLFMDTFLINKLFTKFFSNLSELQSKFLNLKKKILMARIELAPLVDAILSRACLPITPHKCKRGKQDSNL